MGAFGTPTVLGIGRTERLKKVTFTVTGSASYATGGDTLDLSSATLGRTNGFVKRVDGVSQIGVTAAADDVYDPTYVRAAAGAPATGLVKIRDKSAAADAEVANTTDLSGKTFVFVAWGE